LNRLIRLRYLSVFLTLGVDPIQTNPVFANKKLHYVVRGPYTFCLQLSCMRHASVEEF
ncbi:hypothetical protein KIN20_014560, partial [Parelaphostrongylus tenuis]